MNKIFKYIIYLVLIFSIFLIVSCSNFKTPQLINFDDIEVVNENDSLISFSNSSYFYNPNWFSLFSTKVEFQMYSDSIFLGSGYVNDSLYLTPNDTIKVSTCFDFEKSNIPYILSLQDSITLTFVGKSRLPYIKRDYYFEYEYLISLDSLIAVFSENMFNSDNFTINEVNIKELTLSNANLEVVLSIMNDFDVDVVIERLNVTIFKTSDYKYIISNTQIKEPIKIEKNLDNIIKTNINVNPISLGVSMFSNTLTKNNNLYIRIDSEINFNNSLIPITLYKTISYDPINLKINF